MTHVLQLLGRLGRLVAPETTRHFGEQRFLSRETLALRAKLNETRSLDEAVRTVLDHPAFRAEQKPTEIVALLNALAELKALRLCEIGARRGGTLALFAHVALSNASLLSMDLAFSRAQAALNPRLGRPSQRIECWSADSHDPAAPGRVAAWFEEKPLDFLFIDGDHSYEGVKLDYERFSPLVRSGGLIALHDIVPDAEARGEDKSASYSGGVHRFWQELKAIHADALEFIDQPGQDGFGLGVVRAR